MRTAYIYHVFGKDILLGLGMYLILKIAMFIRKPWRILLKKGKQG